MSNKSDSIEKVSKKDDNLDAELEKLCKPQNINQLIRYSKYIEAHMTVTQIANKEGKSPQSVSEYLIHHQIAINNYREFCTKKADIYDYQNMVFSANSLDPRNVKKTGSRDSVVIQGILHDKAAQSRGEFKPDAVNLQINIDTDKLVSQKNDISDQIAKLEKEIIDADD